MQKSSIECLFLSILHSIFLRKFSFSIISTFQAVLKKKSESLVLINHIGVLKDPTAQFLYALFPRPQNKCPVVMVSSCTCFPVLPEDLFLTGLVGSDDRVITMLRSWQSMNFITIMISSPSHSLFHFSSFSTELIYLTLPDFLCCFLKYIFYLKNL